MCHWHAAALEGGGRGGEGGCRFLAADKGRGPVGGGLRGDYVGRLYNGIGGLGRG